MPLVLTCTVSQAFTSRWWANRAMSFGAVLLSMCALHYADSDFSGIPLDAGPFC